MNTKKIISVIALASGVALSSGGAAAAGAGDWAGWYVGGNVGYGINNGVELEYGPGNSSSSFDMKGYMIGVQGGHNWAVGGMVVGVEADATYADIKGDAPCPNPTWSCESKLDQLYTIRARVGVPINNFLLYGTLGAASANVEVQTVSPGGIEYPDSARQTGWVAGIGGDMAVNNNLSARIELLYADFGKDNYTVDFGDIVSVETKVTAVRAGVNWKF